MKTKIQNTRFNEKALLLTWLITLASWLNTALVMTFSPFTILEVGALLFAVIMTQGAISLTKHVGKHNQIVRSIYKNLFGD
ncbi:hypothetical protein L1286_14845 [Pseudoalteromonas sp. SMS1]|uniref:hypothetical protein n=1 Tax=Pseudoalteromonas sp. SMS1 TaxID=2908894 RepID=UPI001F1F4B65|nr:hypothetical protein [Pseudoalteromonas sp. SMS1]MCF2858761.1 hypothetical protein [Pseudoalteromonas sp. SMS1]